MNALNLDNPTEITMSPNKSNIKLTVLKVSNCVEMAMTWMVDELSVKKQAFPKCIIYCQTIKDTSKIYHYLTTEIPECSCHVDMFHYESTEKSKTNIIAQLKIKDSL